MRGLQQSFFGIRPAFNDPAVEIKMEGFDGLA
jgi:hypothetical protein